MPKAKTKIFEVKNLIKTYGEGEGKVFALNDVSLDIYDGEFLVILGASGCGKTSLLNMIAGVDRVDSGSIIYDGQDIVKFNDKKLTEFRGKHVGYIFQFFNLLDDLTVYSNIILAPGANRDAGAIDAVLESVGFADKKDRFPSQLSGGEQQRVSIARALNKNSDILICDEPTGALDYESGKAVLELLTNINEEQKKTVILVTHTKELAAMANRVVVMRNGQIEEILTNKRKKKVSRIEW